MGNILWTTTNDEKENVDKIDEIANSLIKDTEAKIEIEEPNKNSEYR